MKQISFWVARLFVLAGIVGLVLMLGAAHADTCRMPTMVTLCNSNLTERCDLAADGNKYCYRTAGACSPEPQWQCTKDDGSVYAKTLVEESPQRRFPHLQGRQ